jgi:hypothetical protein
MAEIENKEMNSNQRRFLMQIGTGYQLCASREIKPKLERSADDKSSKEARICKSNHRGKDHGKRFRLDVCLFCACMAFSKRCEFWHFAFMRLPDNSDFLLFEIPKIFPGRHVLDPNIAIIGKICT